MQKFTNQQAAALSAIGAWLKSYNKGGAQYITLGGYAGTGKTTLIAALRKVLTANMPATKVGFAAFTGKAALVLKSKLVEDKILRPGDSISTFVPLYHERSESKTFSLDRPATIRY